MFKTGDGKKFKTVEQASKHAKDVFLKTGVFISIEKEPPKRYNVVVYNDVHFHGVLTHKGVSEWTLRTAKKHAVSHAEKFDVECRVIDADEPIHLANILFSTKKP